MLHCSWSLAETEPQKISLSWVFTFHVPFSFDTCDDFLLTLFSPIFGLFYTKKSTFYTPTRNFWISAGQPST